MKYIVAFILCLAAMAGGAFYCIKNDIASPVVSIYVTHHQIDKRSPDYFFNPVSKQIFFSPSGDWAEYGVRKIDGARKLAFTLLSAEYGLSASALYYKATPLPQFDAATVAPLASFDTFSPYVKDKNGVYMMTDDGKPEFVKIADADPESFDIEAAEDNGGKTLFAKDAAHCYYMGRVLTGVSPENFGVLGAAKFEDGTYAYSLDLDSKVMGSNGPIDVAALHKDLLPPEAKAGEDGDGADADADADAKDEEEAR